MNFKYLKNGLLILLVPVAFGLGFLVRGTEPSTGDTHAEESHTERWTCSMHPQIILPSNDQKCPICFMDLIPLEEDNNSGLNPNELSLSAEAAALADVGTSVVQRRFVSRRVPLVGKISVDEKRLREITARFGGRLDRLHLATTGVRVKRGMKLAEIYSPEIYSAQAELQTAAQALADVGQGSSRAGALRLVESARKRLQLLGLDPKQISDIAAGEDFDEHLTVVAPFDGVVIRRVATEGQYVKTGSVLYAMADLSSVWVTLEAYERDLQWLRLGQIVEFSIRSNPRLVFSGEVLFMDPVLNEKTRTVEVRVQVENPKGLLKPGMLVSAEVEAVLDASGQPVGSDQVAQPPLIVPASAPLLTGRRAVVYVKLPGSEAPVYQGREVTLGPRAGDYYLVSEGLIEGEEVVTRGAFKIDSALQILARPSMMMAPEGNESPVEHSEEIHVLDMADVPDEFRHDLAGLLESYLVLQNSLAGDDDSGSASAVGSVSEALARAQAHSTNLPVSASIQWDALYTPMNRALQTMSRSTNLASRRVSFQPLSDNLWLVFEHFGSPESQMVRRFNCPMAFDNEGADWIQLGKVTNNPYYGDMMLRCGSQVATLGQGEN
jgi:membrane fusion protein, copper/silver efflux system